VVRQKNTPGPRLNLPAIEASLRRVQAEFPSIKQYLQADRDSMDDEVVENMLSGYAFLDELISCRTDLFAFGNLKYILELNFRVLCGITEAKRKQYQRYLEATEHRFYEQPGGGIRDVVEWHIDHRNETSWDRAAGVYIRILSDPQLFIEGNHRAGSLVMSYVLATEGHPPFVLSVENAKRYFDLSSAIIRKRKQSIEMALAFPILKRKLAKFLQRQSHAIHLV
jgi:hypothetical protein